MDITRKTEKKMQLRKETTQQQTISANELFRQKYSTLDTLCSAYYDSIEEMHAINKHNNYERKIKGKIIIELKNIVKGFSEDTNMLNEHIACADSCTDGLYSVFIKDMPTLKREDHLLFLYQTMGFSPRSIALFLNKNLDVVYNRKSRLKAKIKKSLSSRRDEYLSVFYHVH